MLQTSLTRTGAPQNLPQAPPNHPQLPRDVSQVPADDPQVPRDAPQVLQNHPQERQNAQKISTEDFAVPAEDSAVPAEHRGSPAEDFAVPPNDPQDWPPPRAVSRKRNVGGLGEHPLPLEKSAPPPRAQSAAPQHRAARIKTGPRGNWDCSGVSTTVAGIHEACWRPFAAGCES